MSDTKEDKVQYWLQQKDKIEEYLRDLEIKKSKIDDVKKEYESIFGTSNLREIDKLIRDKTSEKNSNLEEQDKLVEELEKYNLDK